MTASPIGRDMMPRFLLIAGLAVFGACSQAPETPEPVAATTTTTTAPVAAEPTSSTTVLTAPTTTTTVVKVKPAAKASFDPQAYCLEKLKGLAVKYPKSFAGGDLKAECQKMLSKTEATSAKTIDALLEAAEGYYKAFG